MVYPIALIVMSIGIIAFMRATVVPKIVGVFESRAAELLGLTRGLIATSDFLQNHWLSLLIGIAAIAYGIWRLLQHEGPRRSYHRFLLTMPISSKLTRGINTARFTRTLSILAGSGVPILEALKISAEVIENLPMRYAVVEATVRVKEGGTISKPLPASNLLTALMDLRVTSG